MTTTALPGAAPAADRISRPARAAIFVIEGYRQVISPLRLPCCRYAPTCSEYAVVAIARFGAARGSWLALRRLLRCGPWHRGGFDPVPERTSREHETQHHTMTGHDQEHRR